jgi:hypothetical protein
MKRAKLTALCGATFVVGVVLSQFVGKHSNLATPQVVKAQTSPTWAAREFYLTKTLFPPTGALQACSTGYHMASLWEIFNVSTLKYNTELGTTSSDSGSGPPYQSGWIRTGYVANNNPTPGVANCNGWTDNSFNDHGSAVRLQTDWLHTNDTTAPQRHRATHLLHLGQPSGSQLAGQQAMPKAATLLCRSGACRTRVRSLGASKLFLRKLIRRWRSLAW